jgi:hypothetical protein
MELYAPGALPRRPTLVQIHMSNLLAINHKHDHFGDVGRMLGDFIHIFRQKRQLGIVRNFVGVFCLSH